VQTVAIMNLFGIFVVTAFVASVVIRDDETGFGPILRATRIRKSDYLLGRFTGAVAVAFIVLACVPLGMLVGSWMPWLDAEKVGSFVPGHYFYALFLFGLPTLLVAGAAFFGLATATRSMMWTYIGVTGFLVLYVTSRVLLRDPAQEVVSALTDPFGIGAISKVTKYWTASERNSQLPPVSGLILYNRLIWLGVGAGLFLLSYSIFRFDREGRGTARARKITAPKPDPAPALKPLARPADTGAAHWRALLALTRSDLRFVFKSPAFLVLLALGVFNALGGLTGTAESRGTEYFPVTRLIVGALQGAFTLFPILIAVYYAGEMVWRDRERRIHEIIGATAAPDWAFLVPKVLAITLVLLACFLVGASVGVFYQCFHGYTRFEPGGYLIWFVLPGLITAVQLAALSVFVQNCVPHKFLGWIVMLVYVVAGVTLYKIGFEHNLYNFGGDPGAPLSDMNGLGRFWVGRGWFQAYWLAFSLMLLVASHLLWRRGVETGLSSRWGRFRRGLVGPLGLWMGAALLAWVVIGAFIFYNTNILNEYRTGLMEEKFQADYEKTLLPFERTPQPRIVDVNLAVDLSPTSVRAGTEGTYTIENRTSGLLTNVHLRWFRSLKMLELKVEGAKLEKEYSEFCYRVYAFDQPLQPGEKRSIHFRTLLEERGFPNSRPLTRIVANGTFLNNFEISPLLGMDRTFLLKDRAKRRKHGLPADLRPAKLEDAAANACNYLRGDSDWVNAELHVTTDSDQIPIAPGYAVSDTTAGGRRTLVTRTDAPIQNFFSIQSAHYAVQKDTWKARDGNPVSLAVYYSPPHDHNVRRMLEAMKASLDLFAQSFSPFQFKQARILEFPAYESFAQSFANTIPYSEAIGFIQNHNEKKNDEMIDLVTYVTAHEMGHQWWAHQVIGADKQGATMLSETFAQYSALLVMEQLYGKEQIRKFLKGELDRYLSSRGGEAVEELPLNRVEDQPYIHYQKGSLTMYWLKEVVGTDVVNRALRRLLAQFAFKPAPYPSSSDFLRLLREEAGPGHDQLITDLFEKITLYDMKASAAKAKKLPGGKYEVSFTVEGRKLYADGKGKETEAPLDEPFDIGVFTDEPGKKGYKRESVLLMERPPIKTGKQIVTVIVDREPKLVGVDPYNKRIDRNSDDNFSRIELQQ
jgi:aminopeptidase N